MFHLGCLAVSLSSQSAAVDARAQRPLYWLSSDPPFFRRLKLASNPETCRLSQRKSVRPGGVSPIRPGRPAELIATGIPTAASMCFDPRARQLVIPMNANNAVAFARL